MEDVYVWIDAVCINQHDVKEKNSQVKRMKDIYSRSSRVLIWLRNAGSLSSARSLMMMLIHQRRSGMDEEAIKWDCMRRDPDFSWHDLAVLFTNVWFSRTWIIQEVACAPKAYIATDTALMEWDHLAEAVEILMSPHLARFMDIATVLGVNTEETFAGIARIFQISSLRHRRQRNDSISVAELLRFGLEFDATDRRDKVFALLGLTTQDLPKDLDPDYEKTEQQVYTEAMHFVLGRSYSDFHLLTSIGSESRDRVENIPSWVPDFSSGLRAHYGMASSLLYRAGMKCNAQIEPVPESGSNYIQIAGCRADEITHLGGSSLQLSLQGLKPGGDQQAVLASFTNNVRMWLLDALSITKTAGLNPYFDGSPIRDVFWRTLLGDTDGTQRPLPADYGLLWKAMEEVCGLEEGNESSCAPVFSRHPPMLGGRSLTPEVVDELEDRICMFMHYFGATFMGGRFAVTSSGRLARVPPSTLEGDHICVFWGCPSPFVLRPRDENSWSLVGSCYVHGFMDGEACRADGVWFILA